MKIIAHRANLYGPNPSYENKPESIDYCLERGYDVEVDVRLNTDFYLGHDSGDYKVDLNWLLNRKEYLWIHCKDINSLQFFVENNFCDLNYFWHQDDSYTLTSKNIIWAHPKSINYTKNCVIVMPEFKVEENFYGVCTDYPTYYNIKN